MHALLEDFTRYSAHSIYATDFTTTEKNLVHLIFPADILVRYVFEGEKISVTIRHLLGNIYDKEKIQHYMKSFLVSGDQQLAFYQYITEYSILKQHFFGGIKKYLTHLFQKNDREDDIDGA